MNPPGRIETRIYALLISGLLLPWLWSQINLSINVDLAFLTQSAAYALEGERMSEAYYDTNPPLSILIYLPAAVAMKYTGISIIYATILYSLFFVALSSFLSARILKTFPGLPQARCYVILGAYILTNTIAANLYLGEKDQYILLALFPFTLLQLAITRRLPVSKGIYATTAALAGLFLMVKPHFYIVPIIMFAHRLMIWKRFSAVTKADAWCLVAAALTYAFILYFFFNDFLTLILPDILTLYASLTKEWVSAATGLFLLFSAGLGLIACLLTRKPDKWALFFMLLAALCILPYQVQGKGFYYHALPALVFLMCALALTIENMISALPGTILKETIRIKAALFMPTLLLSYFYYAVFFAQGTIPALTHEQYRQMPMTKLVAQACKEKPDCTFFIFNDTTEIIHQTAAYTRKRHASRFSSFWFLPVLSNPENKTLEAEKKNELLGKYSEMIAKDFMRFKPEILIIGRFNLPGNKPFLDFMTFFSEKDPEFAQEAAHYRKSQELPIDMQTYFPGTLVKEKTVTYDIYTRSHDVPPRP